MPPQQRVVINPDRSAMYLSHNNPYVALSTEDPDEDIESHERLTNLEHITTQNFIVTIPSELVEKAIEIEKYSCTVRFICLLDFFTNLYYMFFGYFFAFIFAFVSLYGYYSTLYHSRGMLFCYLFYQYLQTFTKLSYVSFLIIIGFNNSNNDKQYNNGTQYNSTINNTVNTLIIDFNNGSYIFIIILSLLILLCQIYVTFFIQRYYNLLPNNNERKQLRRQRSSL